MALSKICSDFCENSGRFKQFTDFKSSNDRIKFTHHVFQKYFSSIDIKRSLKSNEMNLYLRNQAKINLNKGRFWEAIKLYSQALAHAEDDVALVKAYKGRSCSLLLLQRLDEAAKDDFRASELWNEQSNGETDEFPLQMADVEKKESQRKYNPGRGDIPPLHGGSSTFFDSASVSVGLGYSDRFERQLVAQSDVKTGEVLIVEKPYASVLFYSHAYTHCADCFGRNLNLQPCTDCCFAMFCSKECEKNSLESYHEIECSVLDVLIESCIGRMELLSLRLLIRASNQGKSLEELYETVQKLEDLKKNNGNNNHSMNSQLYKSDDFASIYNLVTNSDKRLPSDLFYRCVMSSALVQILSRHTNFFAYVPENEKKSYEIFCVGLIFHFMQSLPCNAHEITEFTDDGLNEIGAGIYATLSLVNHSCNPNVVRLSSGNTVMLSAIKPIKKNEQILDNYGYHYATHSLWSRQTSLMKQYYFKCQCEACISHWPEYEELPSENVKFKANANREVYLKLTEKFEENLKNTIKGDFNSETVEEFAKYLDYLDEVVDLPWQNFNNCQEALKHCLFYRGNHFRSSRAVNLE